MECAFKHATFLGEGAGGVTLYLWGMQWAWLGVFGESQTVWHRVLGDSGSVAWLVAFGGGQKSLLLVFLEGDQGSVTS